MKTKTIKQKVMFNASPEEIYDALMDSKKHSAFTRDKAVISNKAGGKFRAYGDYITGQNLELVKGKKILQKWRASNWDKGAFSTVLYELKKVGGKTQLSFTHKDVPDFDASSISKGWVDYYWKPMKEFFKNKQ